MDPGATEGVEVGRHRGHQRLAFTGLHLGDGAFVEGAGPDDLDVEVALAEGAAGGFPHHGESLGGEVIERLAVGDALAELDRLGGELGVGERLDGGFERVDPGDEALELLQPLALADAEDLAED